MIHYTQLAGRAIFLGPYVLPQVCALPGSSLMNSSPWENFDGVKNTDQRSSKLPHLQLSSPWMRKILDTCFVLVRKLRRSKIPIYSVSQTWNHFCWECRWSVIRVRQMGCLEMQSLWLEKELGSLCRWREATQYALGFSVKPDLCSNVFNLFGQARSSLKIFCLHCSI